MVVQLKCRVHIHPGTIHERYTHDAKLPSTYPSEIDLTCNCMIFALLITFNAKRSPSHVREQNQKWLTMFWLHKAIFAIPLSLPA